MPIYEYECRACAHAFTRWISSVRKAEREGPPTCPECGSEDVHKKPSRRVRVQEGKTFEERIRERDRLHDEKLKAMSSEERMDAWREGALERQAESDWYQERYGDPPYHEDWEDEEEWRVPPEGTPEEERARWGVEDAGEHKPEDAP